MTPCALSHSPAGELSLMEPAGEMWSVVTESPNTARACAPLTTGMAAGCIPKPSKKGGSAMRSEEHTSELQSLMRISYAVFCLKKQKYNNQTYNRKSLTLYSYDTKYYI